MDHGGIFNRTYGCSRFLYPCTCKVKIVVTCCARCRFVEHVENLTRALATGLLLKLEGHGKSAKSSNHCRARFDQV